MKKYCLTLDLVDNQELINEYDRWHREVWPEVISSIKDAGIEHMEIYRYHNRLIMMMEVNSSYNAEKKAAMDLGNERVQEWEQLMWKYQQALPGAQPGEKWVMMDKIFEL
ncbi:L-rhamnose mutarotase [Pedobacter immunditicola]|uniref:L-rhamnose mutarotase n=1 Tax=Pedobacter immunditicola TaxID=3133440 RepID=UPI003099E67F